MPFIISLRSRSCPVDSMGWFDMKGTQKKDSAPTLWTDREVKLLLYHQAHRELHSPAVVWLKPQGIGAPLCLKAKIHGRAGTWGFEFSASGSLARSGEREVEGGVRFEGSCRNGKLLDGLDLNLPTHGAVVEAGNGRVHCLISGSWRVMGNGFETWGFAVLVREDRGSELDPFGPFCVGGRGFLF